MYNPISLEEMAKAGAKPLNHDNVEEFADTLRRILPRGDFVEYVRVNDEPYRPESGRIVSYTLPKQLGTFWKPDFRLGKFWNSDYAFINYKRIGISPAESSALRAMGKDDKAAVGSIVVSLDPHGQGSPTIFSEVLVEGQAVGVYLREERRHGDDSPLRSLDRFLLRPEQK